MAAWLCRPCVDQSLIIAAWGAPLTLQALAELERRMAASPVDTPDPETQRWFLRDRKFNVNEAVEKLEAAQRWRRDFRCS